MDNIRITSGFLRGRTISSPKSKHVHPMGSREKIALFNMIGPYLSGSTVLDAFSGSGTIGIEALSRGAKRATFIEKDTKTAQVLKHNLAKVELDSAEVFVCKVKDYNTDKRFDVIFADPPYDNYTLEEVASLIKYLKDDGIFVLSHPGDSPIIEGMKPIKSRSYAGATLSIYQKYT